MRNGIHVNVSSAERTRLEAVVADRSSPQKHVWRARIILLTELARHGMEREFRNIDPAQARVLLVQSGPRLLPAFRERLSAVAEHSLTDLGVEVMTGNRVEEIDEEGVTVAGSRIESRTVFWAAGVIASPAAKWVEGEQDRAGRLTAR